MKKSIDVVRTIMDDERVFVVLVSHGPIASHISYASNILSVSHSEEAAWESIERKINSDFTKNEFGYPCINIYSELKFIRVTVPIYCGCDGTNTIHTRYDYRIIRKPIVD